MYNVDTPTRAELPSTKQLIRSTVIAACSALVILITVILPAEYGIDPTGMGRWLGLNEMGEIKTQLAAEAERDALNAAEAQTLALQSVEETSQPLAKVEVVEPLAKVEVAEVPAAVWRDEISFTLAPGQGAEIKLTMQEGAVAQFDWASQGGPINYDTHGDGGGRSISYAKGRGVPAEQGELVAAFSGNHGWFFRNRNRSEVTVVLRTQGDYGQMKRVL